MFTTRLKPIFAQGKLVAEYYWPTHLADDKRLHTWTTATLEDLRCQNAPISYGVLKPDDFGDRCRVARFENFSGMFVRYEDCDPISESMFEEFQRSESQEGDILIAIGGYVGRPAIVQSIPMGCRLNINRHVARFRPDREQIDAYYALAYLSSPIGCRQLTRQITGSVQAGINLEDLRKIHVPIPDRSAQKYIGNMVRSAEALQRFAHQMERQFNAAVLSNLKGLDHRIHTSSKHGHAKAHELNGSLNPGAFDPDRVHVRNYLKSTGAQRISDIASVETPVTTNYRASDVYIGLDSIGSGLGRISPATIESEGVTGSVRLLSEGPVISKLRPYLNKVAYIPTHLASSFGSTELLCVRANNASLNWYLCGVLRLESTVRQLNPVSTGSTHPRVTRQDILDCYVPWIADAESVGCLLADAQEAYFLSDKLVTAAKLLVGPLIERRVTEDELATAQAQLRLGNQSADRRILSRLYEAGIDEANSNPLFPDLDACYQTQRIAEQALADGGYK